MLLETEKPLFLTDWGAGLTQQALSAKKKAADGKSSKL